MKAFIRFTLILFYFSTAYSSTLTPSLPIEIKIDNVLKQFHENLNVGILVENLKTGQIVYNKNADRYFIPASNEKIFTAWAALNYLGAEFTYETAIFADLRKKQGNILKDNIYLKFSGDPSFTSQQLDHLIQILSQNGIQEIQGSLIVDDTIFDSIPMSNGTTWEDQNYCFGSPIDSMIVDHNCAIVTVSPSKRIGEAPILTLPNQPQFITFINHATTENSKECTLETEVVNETTYSIEGCISAEENPTSVGVAIHYPRENIKAFLLMFLKKNQITLSNDIQFQKIETSLEPLAIEKSPPLASLIKELLKESDNTIANALFKTMGAHYSQNQGTWKNGSEAMRHIIQRILKLSISSTVFTDGSGTSRYNYVTPIQIMILLKTVFHSTSENAKIFIDALPISGVDGTLKERMKSPEMKGRIRAKTGTESGVTALSGYLETAKKEKLAFVILINGFIDKPEKYKVLENRICRVLVKNY